MVNPLAKSWQIVLVKYYNLATLRILGPSNGGVWTCIAGVRVLKIATFEGSGFSWQIDASWVCWNHEAALQRAKGRFLRLSLLCLGLRKMLHVWNRKTPTWYHKFKAKRRSIFHTWSIWVLVELSFCSGEFSREGLFLFPFFKIFFCARVCGGELGEEVFFWWISQMFWDMIYNT